VYFVSWILPKIQIEQKYMFQSDSASVLRQS